MCNKKKWSLLGVTLLALSFPLISKAEEGTKETVEQTTEQTIELEKELVTDSSSLDEKTEITGTSGVMEDVEVTDKIFIDGEWIEITREPEELNGDKAFQAPIITEENQHALGDSVGKNSNQFAMRSYSSKSLVSDNYSQPRIDFVDVSSYQYEISVSDYLVMKSQGVTGVIVKLTESTSYVNPYASGQIKNAKAAGLKVSAYHYSWFTNKATAEKEARFFANEAKKNGLDANTVMVNDAEQKEINNGRLTENSLYFSATLKNEFGFNKVIHYSMASWFTPSIIDMSKLGGDLMSWKAEFPYSPSKNNLLHQSASAWQWASDMKFIGDSNKSRMFDVNIDYSGTFSEPVTSIVTPINKKSFINKENSSIYNRPYTAGTWEQDTTSSMYHELIDIVAQSETDYGLWYQFTYKKSGIPKIGWIKSSDVADIIDEKNTTKTMYLNTDKGVVFDTPYTTESKKIDTTSGFKNNKFNVIKEARTAYGLWYFGNYEKNNIKKEGWIKSVDLDGEPIKIEAYSNKGFINKTYAAIFPSPYVAGVSSQGTTAKMKGDLITLTAKSETSYGIWYEFSYQENGTTRKGWLKSVDIDYVIDEKNTTKTVYLNTDKGVVFDTPYTTESKKIDTTNGFKNNEFKVTKEARTGYGLWYFGSYTKNNAKKEGWIKSVDFK
ncbi:GH25 family lysozyme [Vagococcus fluvialis]|uniref:GH25 family lysozyme n=1 Tax=Vagococcus fluvialis TaxID=2738 RepID=UPI003B5B1B22